MPTILLLIVSNLFMTTAWYGQLRFPHAKLWLAILISKRFERSGVSHKDFDTTSIIKMIEQRFDLDPLVARKVRSLKAALHAAEH